MRKILPIIFSCLLFEEALCQNIRKVSTYLLADFNQTLYDNTKGNNPRGIGLGLQALYNTNSAFKPAMELSAAIYPEDDKVLRLDPNGNAYEDIPAMVNLFFGTSYHPSKRFYLSILGGPSFIERQTFLGVKPSVGFYFSDNQRWTGKVSCINIFNRTSLPKKDFGSVSFSLGIKLF